MCMNRMACVRLHKGQEGQHCWDSTIVSHTTCFNVYTAVLCFFPCTAQLGLNSVVCAEATDLQALLADPDTATQLHRIRTLLIPAHHRMKPLLLSNPQPSQNAACQPLTVSSSRLQFSACRSSTLRGSAFSRPTRLPAIELQK